MAKSKAPSKHSRAARRASPPGISTDKSPREASQPRAASPSSGPAPAARPSVLAAQRSAGVQKKRARPARKSRVSAKARRRHDRDVEAAEAVRERTAARTRRSQGRARAVVARRMGWDDVNREAARGGGGGGGGRAGAGGGAFDALAGGPDGVGEDGDEDEDEDEDEDMEAEDGGAAGLAPIQQARGEALVTADDDGDVDVDEIL